jgi:hypothetical protein
MKPADLDLYMLLLGLPINFISDQDASRLGYLKQLTDTYSNNILIPTVQTMILLLKIRIIKEIIMIINLAQ